MVQFGESVNGRLSDRFTLTAPSVVFTIKWPTRTYDAAGAIMAGHFRYAIRERIIEP
jgi:hypothetical protein